MNTNQRILRLDKAIKAEQKDLRGLVKEVAATVLDPVYLNGRNTWTSWDFSINEDGILRVWGITFDDRGPDTLHPEFKLDLKAAIQVEEDRQKFCGTCGEPWVSQTKSIPQKRICKNGHTWITGRQ